MAISMLKIRRPLGRLIFNMGIAIPGKTVFLIETAPRTHTHKTLHISFAKGMNNLKSSLLHENNSSQDPSYSLSILCNSTLCFRAKLSICQNTNIIPVIKVLLSLDFRACFTSIWYPLVQNLEQILIFCTSHKHLLRIISRTVQNNTVK